MRIIFMGTPELAAVSLEALSKEHNIVAAFSQPDKPKGRGHKLQPTPVKETAQRLGIQVRQPQSLREGNALEEFGGIDLIVVAAYGQILPKYVLDYPKYGCINVHASLLPKYRGAAPIQWCIINGERESGVTIMQMNEGLDTGDMLSSVRLDIGSDETAGELYDRLSYAGAQLLVETIPKIERGEIKAIAQDDSESSYAPKITRETGHIDWTKSASDIRNLIRGTNPYPTAYTEYEGETLKIIKAEQGRAVDAECGTLIGLFNNMLEVACGDGQSIFIKILQFKGGKKMDVRSYLNGHTLNFGVKLGKI